MERGLRWVPVLLLVLSASACDFVGDVFEAGFWVGAIVVVLVLALIVWGIFQFLD